MYSDDEDELFSLAAAIPLLPQHRDNPNLNNNHYLYGSSSSSSAWTKKTGAKLMQRSPLIKNEPEFNFVLSPFGCYNSLSDFTKLIWTAMGVILGAKASIVVPTSHTVYKNGKPKYENYKIKIVNNNKMFFHPLMEGVCRSFKEFCWLRKYFVKQYRNQIIPSLPPNYFFRRNYERGIVNERRKGLQEFLQGCVDVKHLVADEMFHLFIQSDFSVTEMTKQQESANNKLSFFHCFSACSHRAAKEHEEDDDDEIDYDEFKKELACVLKEAGNKQINLYQH